MSTMPAAVAEVRREICGACDAKCPGYLAGTIDHANPCTGCPGAPRRFGPYGRCVDYQPAETLGLGDVVAGIAQPLARTIDRFAGTNLANCGGCTGSGGRKDQLNAAVPDIRHPFSGGKRARRKKN